MGNTHITNYDNANDQTEFQFKFSYSEFIYYDGDMPSKIESQKTTGFFCIKLFKRYDISPLLDLLSELSSFNSITPTVVKSKASNNTGIQVDISVFNDWHASSEFLK